MNKRH